MCRTTYISKFTSCIALHLFIGVSSLKSSWHKIDKKSIEFRIDWDTNDLAKYLWIHLYIKIRILSFRKSLIWSTICVGRFFLVKANYCVKTAYVQSSSGLFFPAFGLNTYIYSASLSIQSKNRKIPTRKTPNSDTFYAVNAIRLPSITDSSHR